MGNKQARPQMSHEEAWGSFSVLPAELVLHVLRLADPRSLCGVGSVNTVWQALAKDDLLWKPFFTRMLNDGCHLQGYDGGAGSQDQQQRENTELQQVGLDLKKSYKALIQELVALRKDAVDPRKLSYDPQLNIGVRSMLCKIKVGKLLVNGKRSRRVVMVGLDAAGKTTILYALDNTGNVTTTIPTIGYNIENVVHGKLSLMCWDVGGPDKIRPLWQHYLQDIEGLIYVVDITDHERMDEAARELQYFLDKRHKAVPVLVYANKIDMPRATLSMEQVAHQLGLHEVKDRKWHVQPSCAPTKAGLYEGLSWLASA